MTDRNINRVQRVQNSLTRLITNSNSNCHITPFLAELHWLPANARIDYKVALLTYEAMTTQRPVYLSELQRLHRPVRHLRSGSHCFYVKTALRQFLAVARSANQHRQCGTHYHVQLPTIVNLFPSLLLNVISRLIFTVNHFYCRSRDWTTHAISSN
jgi:hypothetical protein